MTYLPGYIIVCRCEGYKKNKTYCQRKKKKLYIYKIVSYTYIKVYII